MQLQPGRSPDMGTTTAADKRREEHSSHRAPVDASSAMADAYPQQNKPLPPRTRLTLERVLGITSLSNAMLAVNPVTGEIAYAAGCIVVIYNLRRNKQVRYYRVEKSVSCLCFSPNGQYLAIGEKGYLPAITIWDGSDGTLCAELQMHKYGVVCMAFSRDGKYLLSAGLVHDQHLYVWDLTRPSPAEPMNHNAVGVATVTDKILAMDYCHEGNFFVTAGEKHVQFWFLDADNRFLTTGYEVNHLPEIQGRAAVMATKEEATFTSVACGYGAGKLKTFAVTSDGTLCSFGVSCVMERLVSLEAAGGNAISVTEAYIAVGGASSVIRLFDPSTLEYKATMPFPPPFGKANEPNEAPANQLLQPEPTHRYPAAVGVRLTGSHVVAMYSDRSLFIFDISKLQDVQPDRSFLFHSGGIRDLKIAGKLRGVNARGKFVYSGADSTRKAKSEGAIPQGAFITCGDDNTVRFWHLDLHRVPKSSRFSNDNSADDHPENEPWKNPYSQELLEVLYCDHERDFDDADAIVLGGTCSATDGADIHSPAKDPGPANSQRVVAIHPNLTMMVSGDKEGTLQQRTLPFAESAFTELGVLGAEVQAVAVGEVQSPVGSKILVAAGGRDRLVHVYDSSKSYSSIAKLDNHSGAVTCVLFTQDGKKLISCGADKTLVLSDVDVDGKISRYNSVPFTGGKIFDVALTSDDQNLIASSNNRLDILSVGTGKHLRSLHVGEQHRIDVCPANFCVAMSGSMSDKTIHIVDLQSGDTLADGTGHGEVITGIKFTPDCRRLVSSSSDGCIFVWRLAEELQAAIKARLPRVAEPVMAPPPAPPVHTSERSIPTVSLMPPPAPPVPAKRIPQPTVAPPVAAAVQSKAEPKAVDTVGQVDSAKKDDSKGWKGRAKAIPGPFAKVPMEDWMRTRETAKKTVCVDDEDSSEPAGAAQPSGVMNIDRSKTPDWARTFQVSAIPTPARKSPSKPVAGSKWAQRQPAVPQPSENGDALDTTGTNDTLLNLSIATMDVSQSAALTSSSLALEREQLEKRKKQMETAKAVAEMNSRLSKMGLLRPQKAAAGPGTSPTTEPRPTEPPSNEPSTSTPKPQVSPDTREAPTQDSMGFAGIPAEMFESIDVPLSKPQRKQEPKTSPVKASVDLRVDQSMSAFTSGFTSQPAQPDGSIPVDQSLSVFSEGYRAADAMPEPRRVPEPVRARGIDVDASLSAFTDGFSTKQIDPVKQSVDLSAVAASMSVFTQGYTGESTASKPQVTQGVELRSVAASLSQFTTGYEAPAADVEKDAVTQSLSMFTSGFTASPPTTVVSPVRASTSSGLPVNESLSTFTAGYNASESVKVTRSLEVAQSLSTFTTGYARSMDTGPVQASSETPEPPQEMPVPTMVEKRAAALSTINDLDVQLLATAQVLRSLVTDAESDPEVVEMQDLIVRLRKVVEHFVSKR